MEQPRDPVADLSRPSQVYRGLWDPQAEGTVDYADIGPPSDVRVNGEALSALALSREQVEKFDRDGFVATDRPVFTASELDWLRQDLNRLTRQDPPHPKCDLLHELHYNEAAGSGQVLFHCLGHWRLARSFHGLVYHDAIALPASQLLQGRPVRFWHDQAFVKPGGDGACVQWHQVCVPRRPARLVPKLTSLASGRGRITRTGTAPGRWPT